MSLCYRNGSSDEEYRVWLEPKDDGFLVNFTYGRHGWTLTTGTKTKAVTPWRRRPSGSTCALAMPATTSARTVRDSDSSRLPTSSTHKLGHHPRIQVAPGLHA